VVTNDFDGIAANDSFEHPKAAPIESVVPDLKGLTLREVLTRVTGTGVKVNIKGQGFVSQTVPAAGKRLGANKQITLILSRDEN
jgi:hypothetical protein